jgi:hypothetical protein
MKELQGDRRKKKVHKHKGFAFAAEGGSVP